MTADTLFTAEQHITSTIAQYEQRMAVVKERYAGYHPDVTSRRYVADSYGDAARSLRAAQSWLAGEYDRTYAGPHPSFGTTLQDFRDHYADSSLQSALHYLLDAEYHAGLIDRDTARAADPWTR
jgi:hypothetical protein